MVWPVEIVLMTALTAGCSGKTDERSRLLVRKWSYKEFRINDETMSGEQLDNPVMEFFADGTYNLDFGAMTEKGQWKIHRDELVTVTGDGAKTDRLKIEELSENKLVLHSVVEGNKACITMVPAADGN